MRELYSFTTGPRDCLSTDCAKSVANFAPSIDVFIDDFRNFIDESNNAHGTLFAAPSIREYC